VICIDARHAKAVLKMQINNSDRNDAAGIANAGKQVPQSTFGHSSYLSTRRQSPAARAATPIANEYNATCN
jgi:hypothetical protein